ncbi:hypothetical protein [Gluconobacter sp. Gdi]|uniref:hypothetical protein n=1 Tax=Gluconobacter sp. Gdi TaxID=2691888 RepID=UPI00175FC81E|nr:hypothetical protein [Gluconobacter sp. Gdi]GFE97659.1 hypothetical protein DmGdi_27320 [Gluconobacter sp. Gdi]
MSGDKDKITLKIHGLEVDNDLVRADVFVMKLRAVVDSLKRIDRLNNKKKRHQYIITDLQIGSALATIREKISTRSNKGSSSSIDSFSDIISSVYDGDSVSELNLPKQIFANLRRLTSGSSKAFSHAELTFPHGRIIRIDEFLADRVRDVSAIANDNIIVSPEYFLGTAYGTFEGVLQELDARGTLLRGKLILNGGVELDCVLNRDEIPTLREQFNQRVSVDAAAHYDGRHPLPVRLEIRRINRLEEMGDLTKWKGAFKPAPYDDMDEEW